MKNILYITVALLLFSCNKKSDERKVSNIDSAIIKLPDTAHVSENKLFLDQFKTISPDTLLIESPADPTVRPANSNKISPDFAKIFPKGMYIGNPEQPLVYALSKFDLDKKNVALLTQTMGEKAMSVISLLIYNKPTETITAHLEIADAQQDERFSGVKKTWIIRDSSQVKGYMWYSSEVHPLDANDPTRPSKMDDYFEIKFKNGKIDTARTNAAKMKIFLHMLK